MSTITENSLATGLVEPAQRYRECISQRRTFVSAADRFYHELVIYQWRVDALDTQLEAISEAIPTNTISEDDLLRRCATACSLCNARIEVECSVAVAGIEERAKNYCVSSLMANGEVQLARGEEARKQVVAALRARVLEVFKEIAAEVRELLAIADYDGLQALVRSLQRRRGFWRDQLEEVWAQWQNATESMHRAGDEALSAWVDIRRGFHRLLQYASRPVRLNQVIADGLATTAAHCFEVELYDTLGLSGLAAATSSSPKKSYEQSHPLAPEQRILFIKELYEILSEGEVLDVLGEAIAKAVTCYSATVTASVQVEIEGRLQANSDGDAQTQTSSDAEVLRELLPRLRSSLAEALRKAVLRGCEYGCNRVLRGSALLGGQDFVKAVITCPGQHDDVEHRTPMHLAAHRNQNHRLLLDWLDGAQEHTIADERERQGTRVKTHTNLQMTSKEEFDECQVNPQDQSEEYRSELCVQVQ